MYTFGICRVRCSKPQSCLSSNPEDTGANLTEMVWNRMGRYINYDTMFPVQHTPEQNLITLVGQRLNITKSKSWALTFNSELFPVCPSNVSCKRSSYIYSDTTTSNLTSKSLVRFLTLQITNFLFDFPDRDTVSYSYLILWLGNGVNNTCVHAFNARIKM